MQPERVLVLGAWDPEIAPLRPLARRLGRRRAGPRLVLDVVGVGPVDAALGAEAALARHGLGGTGQTKGLGCIFVGTAGVYRAGGRQPPLALGGAALVHRLHLVATAAVRGEGYWPGPAVRTLDANAGLRGQLATAAPELPAADLLNTLVITSSSTLARRLARAHEDLASAGPGRPLVENLEAFAVARACARRRVPFAALAGISNVVGPDAHATWKTMAPVASQAVAAVFERWLG